MDIELRHLTEEDNELIAVASAVIAANVDVERDIHTVGAAVRDSAGNLHAGVNVHHFTGGPCAELVALGAARASGARALSTIVAVGDGGRVVMAPCGRDRQVLADYHPGIRVLVPTLHGVRSVAILDLLPLRYDWVAEQM